MASDPHFLSTIALSHRLISEQYHLELALRFVIFRRLDEKLLTGVGNLGDFLTATALDLCQDPTFDRDAEAGTFVDTFTMLDEALGDSAFKRWNNDKQRFQGAFLNTAFEVIGMGLGYHVDEYESAAEADPVSKAKSFWSNTEYSTGFATGVRADTRMARSIPLGRSVFER